MVNHRISVEPREYKNTIHRSNERSEFKYNQKGLIRNHEKSGIRKQLESVHYSNFSIKQAPRQTEHNPFTHEFNSNLASSSKIFVHEDIPRNDNNDEKNQKGNSNIVITNFKKLNDLDNSTIKIGPSNTITEYRPQKIHLKWSKKELKETIEQSLLPNNYPHSVTPGYMQFSLLFGLSAV